MQYYGHKVLERLYVLTRVAYVVWPNRFTGQAAVLTLRLQGFIPYLEPANETQQNRKCPLSSVLTYLI